MKNNTISFILILTILFLTTSCEDDLLDKSPLDKISSSDVWNDKGLIDAYMVDLYARIIPGYLTWDSPAAEDVWSDDIQADKSNRSNVVEETITSANDLGFNQYANIWRVNTAIEGLTNTKVLDETVRTQLLAEAKTFRAIIYHWMVRRFGGVMKVDRVMDPNDDMLLPRTTENEIYDFIIDDLTYAKDNLPTSAAKGKFNKATAHGFLIRALTEALRYDEVISECNDFIISKGNYGYSIDPDYNGIFNLYSSGISSSENIFIRYGDNSGIYMLITPLQYLLPLSNRERTKPECDWSNIKTSMYGWAMWFPTQQLVDSYQVVENGVAKNWWETDKWLNRKDEPNSTEIMWENRDKRFYASITYDGSIFAGDLYKMRYPYFPYRRMMNTDQHYAMTGYYVRKFTADNITSWSSMYQPWDYHWVLLRLSEVYLNYAEALIQRGRAADALPYINELRVKHGELPPLVTTDNIWENYKRERRVEMFMERDRYWALLRWGKIENLDVIPELNENSRYIDISPDGSKYYIATIQGQFYQEKGANYAGDLEYFESLSINDRSFEPGVIHPNRQFTSKRYYLPIPKWHLDRNSNLTQNPGWN